MAWQEGNEAAWKQEGWAENPYSKDLPGWAAAGSNTRPATGAGREAKEVFVAGSATDRERRRPVVE